jgi:xanthine dehydrogenase accessory factor
MKEILPDINQWLMHSKPIALATVIQTWGSSPRKVGAKMAFTAVNELSGSVSGGCVEGAVISAGVEMLADGLPRLLHFGVADETAWGVGLACGGTIEVFVEPLQTEIFNFVGRLLTSDERGTVITVIRGPQALLGNKLAMSRAGKRIGTLGDAALDEAAMAAAETAVSPHHLQLTDAVELFIDIIQPMPKLVLVGGVHIAIALASLAQTVGFHTTVIDPRRAFGSEARFPYVDRLIQAWPEQAFAQVELTAETAVALLTHDPKIDDLALHIILNSPVFYVGALGSRKTHTQRVARLKQSGISDALISCIHAPIGLDIGANTPEEIALAILAEIVQAKTQLVSSPKSD